MRKRIAQCRMGPPILHLHTRCKKCGGELLLASYKDYILSSNKKYIAFSSWHVVIGRWRYYTSELFDKNNLSNLDRYILRAPQGLLKRYKKVPTFDIKCSKCSMMNTIKQDCCLDRKFVERFRY